MNEELLEPAKYLQPVDSWTGRGAQVLAMRLQRHQPKNDAECAKVIIEASQRAGVRPSLVNTGLWIFGARFAETEDRFKSVLTNSDDLCRFLEDRRQAYEARVQFLDKVLGGSR